MQRGELSEARICATGCCTKPHIKQRGSDGVTRQELFTWIRQQYGTEPEYPWHDWNAVLRHNDNNKWYGVVLEVSADKLGLPEAGIIDVLNVKSDPLLIGSLRGQDGYFPAYHMNKEKWLSIQLGKPELDDAIKDLLSLSYELTAPKKRKPKSSAKNPGDSANGKENDRKGKQWLLTYTGSPKKMNKHYRERFHVDAVTAAKDLQELGVNYTQEQLDQIKQAEEQRLRQRRMEREAKERERLAELYEDCDGHFAFIAGYTDGGAPYGVMWEEVGIDPGLPFEEKVKLYHMQMLG